MTWKANVHLTGLRFKGLEPTPVSTDSEGEASWAPIDGAKRGVLQIGLELDAATRIAIAANSGTIAAVGYTSNALIDAIFYVTFLVLLLMYRKAIEESATNYKTWQRVRAGVRAARWISVLGLSFGAFRTAAYWWYGKTVQFNGLGMPVTYYRWPGLIIVCAIGLMIFVFGARVRRVLPILFGSLLITYGVIVLIYPQWFDLNEDFSRREVDPSVLLVPANILSDGGQLVLMILLTCAVLFVAITVLRFTFRSMQFSSASETEESSHRQQSIDRSLPIWKMLISSFLISLVLIFQWVWQRADGWGRNNVFPAFDVDRDSRMIADMTSGMITYYLDLFGELAINPVAWASIAAIIYILCWLGRSTRSVRPSMGEYRLLGLLFAAFVVPTGDWYIGFTVPITFATAFVIVGFIIPWSRRFNPLNTICVRPSDVKKPQVETALLTMLPGSLDLRSRLVTRQVHMDALRGRARSLEADLAAGKMDFPAYTLQREEIESLLGDCRFPPPSRELSAILQQRVTANDQIDVWQLSQSVRPAEVALAIGPRSGWWEIGVLAAKIGAVVSAPAIAYSCYIDTKTGGAAAFDSYLGPLHLLWEIVWQVGFWVVAPFILGCLWTTLPGRQGSIKGTVLWMGFAIPFAVGVALGRALLHQDTTTGAYLLSVPLLLLELFLVGLILDWFTLLDADTFRIHKWQPLVTLYGVRRLVPTLGAVVPLLATLIGVYLQVRSGLGSAGSPQTPITPSSGR